MTEAELFRSAIEYFPETGLFVWKVSPGRKVPAGSMAGSISHWGYWVIRYRGRLYRAHRVAWLLMTGNWPAKDIDHRNGDRSDNRWNNLREATRAQNAANRIVRGKYPKGVTLHRCGKFQAQIKKNGKKHYLGLFHTAEGAATAYAIAAKQFFGEFARTK